MAKGHVHVRLLGGFFVAAGDVEVVDAAWRLRKAKTLLKLLALAPGRRLHQQHLGETLWPDRDAAAVRNNLHQTLHAARAALGAGGLDGRQIIRLQDGVVSLAGEVTVDVDEFAAAAYHAHETSDVHAYLAAADLYRGELLPEDRYEDWTRETRDQAREQFTTLLMGLARLHQRQGHPEQAIEALRRLLIHHEIHEPARRELMRLLAQQGRRQEALAEYESLRDALRRTLEADPDVETRHLYRRLLAGSLEEQPVPAATVPAGPAHNLPLPASSFVGREREVAEVQRLLAGARLLTLTGVGGAGKTRLAVEVARTRQGRHRHGVWLIDLAPASEESEVPLAIAKILGLELPERAAPVPALVQQLAGRDLLLLLDNCEHLLTTCADLVAAVLRSCPEVIVLATSREALRIEGEVAWRVPSLALPDLRRLPHLDALADQASVRLFTERAQAADPQFRLTPRNAATVADLCIHLDGLPLALELAAARVQMLSPRQILDRLSDVLDASGAGDRAGVNRQQTLAATLDWSHDLLAEPERMVFRRLAVFAGSFPLEAAEHVCGVDPLAPTDVLTLLGRLVEQSLVVPQPHGEVTRYRLLETVRQYGTARLAEAAEDVLVRGRHRDWYADWAQAHDPERAAAAGEESLHHFDVEHDNLRAALRTALDHEPEQALRLATSLWRFWLSRGHFAEGRRWLEAVLAADPSPSALRARALIGIAVLDMRYAAGNDRLPVIAREIVDIHAGLGDQVAYAQALHLAAILIWTSQRYDAALAQLDEAVDLGHRLDADHVLAAASHTRGVMELGRGRPDEAQHAFEVCDALLGDLTYGNGGFFPAITIGFSVEWDGDRPRLVFEETLVMGHRLDAGPAKGFLRFSQAWAARAAKDPDLALAYAEESAATFASQRWDYGVALAHNLLGSLHRQAGRYEAARRCLERSLALRARLGDRRATGVTLGMLGMLAAAEGEMDTARRHMRRALELFERIEDGFGEAGTLLNLGVVALRSGDTPAAKGLFEQVRHLRDAPGMARTDAWVRIMLAEVVQTTGDTRAAALHVAGARKTFAELGELTGLRHCHRLLPAPIAGAASLHSTP